MSSSIKNWEKFINSRPTISIGECHGWEILYLDTKDDHPKFGEPDHKFRPMLFLNSSSIAKNRLWPQLFKELGSDIEVTSFLIPITSQYHPDQQPIHNSYVKVPWEIIAPNQPIKTSYFSPLSGFALTDKEMYSLEDHDLNFQFIRKIGTVPREYQKALIATFFQKILEAEKIKRPYLADKNELQRLDWHDKYGSRGGKNNLVASYKQHHPTTTRFSRPALNQPPLPSVKSDDGPDL